VFAGLSGLLFRRLLLQATTLMDLDFPNIHIPFRTYAASVIGAGRLPLWVAQLQFGLPYLANGDTAVLYPFQAPFLLMDPLRAAGLLLWLHTVLSMLTMYAFVRIGLRLNRAPAIAGGIVFGLNGFFMAHLGLLGLVYAQAWVPLVLLGLVRATDRLAWSVVGAAGVALSLLAGHPQQLFFCAPAILIFITSRVVRRRSIQSLQRLIAASVLVVAIGAGIAAVQILPQAELLENSHRRLMSFEEATFGSLEGDRMWTVLLPDYGRDYGGEAAGWVGATGVLLATAGVVSLCRRSMLADLACWLAILFSSLLFSSGASTPVYGILLDIWPGLESFRFPVRFLYPAVLSVSVLGSYGFQALVDGIAGRPMRRGGLAILGGLAAFTASMAGWGAAWEERRLLLLASALAVGIGGVAWMARSRIGRQAVTALILMAVAFELVSVSSFMSWNHPSPVEAYQPGPIRSYLEQHPGTGRLASVPAGIEAPPQMLAAAVGNAALLTATPSVEAFGGQWPTDRLFVLQEGFTDKLRQDEPAAVQNENLLGLLGVEYVVGAQSQQNLSAAAHLRPVATEGELTLYRALEVGPRVRTFCGARFEADPRRLQEVVLGDRFDASVLWIESTGNDEPSRPCGDASISGEYQARLDIRVSLPDDGWVFLADSWYPGWTAQVDGEAVNVEVANAFFRAVRVPAGEHDVTFAYRPLSFRLGLAITAGTLSALLSALLFTIVRTRLRRRQTRHRQPAAGIT